MGKITVDLSYDFLSINNIQPELSINFASVKSLYDAVKYFVQNDNENSYFCFSTEEELADKKVRIIAQKLAVAIDKNSVEEVKALKQEYCNDEEFLTAKKFLDKKCKEVWNVYEFKKTVVPYAAMKVLGISNRPSLESLLGNSVKYFEKDNGNTTAIVIESVLNNKNLDYTIEDIHNYLVLINKKEKCKYNLDTAQYFIKKHNYDMAKLQELGFSKEEIFSLLKTMGLTYMVKYIASDLKNIFNAFVKSISVIFAS